HGLVGDAASGRLIRAAAATPFDTEPEALGRRVAEELLELGAGELLKT
ncbi:MAG TPA: hydroxymethylbilane synthase, partial [Rudaea sp.]